MSLSLLIFRLRRQLEVARTTNEPHNNNSVRNANANAFEIASLSHKQMLLRKNNRRNIAAAAATTLANGNAMEMEQALAHNSKGKRAQALNARNSRNVETAPPPSAPAFSTWHCVRALFQCA